MTKKQKILKAAQQVFSQKGFHQAQMDEIAKRAKVAKGTLYYNFSSKSELFATTVTKGMEEIVEKVEEELNSDLPFTDHFKQLIRVNISLYLKYSDLSKIVFNELSSGIDTPVLKDIEEVRNRYINFITDLLQHGQEKGYIKEINLKLAAVGIVGLLDNLCNYYMRNTSVSDQDSLVETMYTILSSGLIIAE